LPTGEVQRSFIGFLGGGGVRKKMCWMSQCVRGAFEKVFVVRLGLKEGFDVILRGLGSLREFNED
jgi:hypothetical protein